MPTVWHVGGGFLFIAFRLETAAKSERASLAAAATRKTFNAIYGVKKREKEIGKKSYI